MTIPGASGRGLPGHRVRAGVVDVEPEPVRRAVHEESVVRLIGDPIVDGAGEQAELDHARGQLAHAVLVDLVDRRARLARARSPRPGREHDVVDPALRRREPAVRGPRARDVGGVVVVLAAGVDEHEVAVADRASFVT